MAAPLITLRPAFGLVNNAAIWYDPWQRALNAVLDQVHQAVETNTLGPWRMAHACVPLLRRSEHGQRHAGLQHVENGARRRHTHAGRRPAWHGDVGQRRCRGDGT